MPTPSPEMGGYNRSEVPKPIEVVPSQEKAPSAERNEVQRDMPTSQPSIIPVTPLLPIAPPLPQTDDSQTPQPLVDNNPISASDDELIEKEWVDKAKRIVYETKSDPYRQESEVSRLQADYVKKRYGKDIKLSN